jgi:hypothetical protein
MAQVLLFAVVLGIVFPFFEEDSEERASAFIEPFVIILSWSERSDICRPGGQGTGVG